MQINREHTMTLLVKTGPFRKVGKTPQGELTIIPIVGGSFKGVNMSGKVCLGGADWNTRVDEFRGHVFAKYWLESEDGEIISIENEGFPDSRENTHNPIITTPRFQVDQSGKYAHLGDGNYMGEVQWLGGEDNVVEVVIYRIKP